MSFEWMRRESEPSPPAVLQGGCGPVIEMTEACSKCSSPADRQTSPSGRATSDGRYVIERTTDSMG